MIRVDVLDHGYVELIEPWGSDQRIIEAARMSTDKGFVGWGTPDAPGDERLLKYLWVNKHYTPFEMAGAIVEVQAPIFVFREWMRHRTQCVSGDTKIVTLTPRGTSQPRTIKQIHDLRNGVVDNFTVRHKNGRNKSGGQAYTAAKRKRMDGRVRVLPSCQNRILRVLNEDTLEFTSAKMKDVWEAGRKELFLIETEEGRSIKASAEHPFLTSRGWVKVKHLREDDLLARLGVVASGDRSVPPSLRQGIGVWTTMQRCKLIKPVDLCYVCNESFYYKELQLDHVIPVKDDLLSALDSNNLRPVCIKCHRTKSATEQGLRKGQTRRGVRWSKLAFLPRSTGVEMTYDIEVEGTHHNYLANEFVVHNSFNELSARYSPIPDINYVPSIERLLLGGDGKNKQAGTIKDADVLTVQSASSFQEQLRNSYAYSQAVYENALKSGVPKELARVHLPVGRYSRMRVSANLRNWLAFVTLRSADNAQWEIRQYSDSVKELLESHFAQTMKLFNEYGA